MEFLRRGKERTGQSRSRLAGGLPDARLVASCLDGDDRAWEQLVERYSALVFTVARKYDLSVEDAADVHWRTWETLFEDLPRLRERQKLGPWLITVAGRLAWHHSDWQRRHPAEPLDEIEFLDITDPDPQPEETVISADSASRLHRALATLPERCQRLVTLLFLDRRAPTYRQISAELGVALASLSPLKQRCLRRLKTAIDSLDG